jgi:hypothetical protein
VLRPLIEVESCSCFWDKVTFELFRMLESGLELDACELLLMYSLFLKVPDWSSMSTFVSGAGLLQPDRPAFVALFH